MSIDFLDRSQKLVEGTEGLERGKEAIKAEAPSHRQVGKFTQLVSFLESIHMCKPEN